MHIIDTWPFKAHTQMNAPQTLCKYTTSIAFKTFSLDPQTDHIDYLL